MANQVTHTHRCPTCRQEQEQPCSSPECQRLPARVCARCMEWAWRHSRKNVRRTRPGVSRPKAA